MTARTDDYDEIVRVVQLYIDGFNDNDISKTAYCCASGEISIL